MTAGANRFWALITLLLIAVIVIGGIIVWQKYSPSDPIEITLSEETDATDGVSPQDEPQKIDINRAEAWLLEALPGIGPSKAQAIIDYREQNGGFSDVVEITEVPGIGMSMYEDIQNMITVGD
ncbi:MAG TPA: ComEA family DNA-binding protein [Dehalococcoidales bacterium]|nr:ComEA family DNA-binding protein [Dehalococcoidales bacterium]